MVVFFKRESITRHDSDPYLERLVIFRCRWFGVYLHRFVGSDDECLHDHPWPFLVVILWGGYWEHVGEGWGAIWGKADQQAWQQMRRRWHPPGSFLFRRANHAHRIELDPARPRVWSLVITGTRVRAWGFFTRFGWLPWQKYRYSEHCS